MIQMPLNHSPRTATSISPASERADQARVSLGSSAGQAVVAVEIADVEWVTDHLEAHGHLLVHGSTLAEIAARAQAAIGAHSPAGLRIRPRILHPGWWRVEPCRCRRSLACSNHPAWHYRRVAAGDSTAFRGAEVRLAFEQAPR
jgi:hypothetical protein